MSKLGLKNGARNPGSIANIQHHDPSGAQKNLSGIAGTIKSVVATSTTATPLTPEASLWVVNRNAATQYVFVGKASDAPVTVDATNGMALPPNFGTMIFCGISDDLQDAIVVKTSHADVHVTILES